MSTLGMTCWVDLKVAHEWPPLLDDLADALLLRLDKMMLSRGSTMDENTIERRYVHGTLPSDTHLIHVIYVTVLADELD